MSDVHLSIVVLSWNTREILRACLTALEREIDIGDQHAGPEEAGCVFLARGKDAKSEC